MKQLLFGAGICLVTAVGICYATMGGQYSVNIHFVPPLVTGACSVAQFWNPPNVTCALCFCMTGTLSRCIPQPGCVPNNATNNATTPGPAVAGNVPVGQENVTEIMPETSSQTTPAVVGPTGPTAAPPVTTPAGGATQSTAAPAVATNLIRKRRGLLTKF